MQSISDSLIQNQIAPNMQKISEREGIAAHTVKSFQHSDMSALPADVVILSTRQASMNDASADKKPSVPVTEAERMALRESFSVYV
jgi:hypothetical protein